MPLLETALLAALALLLLWKGVLPAWKHLNTDFPNYYLVARLWREGYSLDRIYDWTWLQRVKDHWGLDQALVGFAGLTPLSALPVAPLTFFSALAAKRIWIVVNLGLLAASVELMARSTMLGRRRVWIIALLAVFPLRTSFLFGQMHIAVLFLMTLAFFLHVRNREFGCGLCVALAAALKVYPIAFLLYFLWKRQWRAAAGTVAASVVLLVAAGATMGWELQRIYLFEMFPRSLQGEVLDPYSLHAAAGAAVFHRLFLFEPVLNPTPAFASSMAYAWVYPLWQLTILLPLFALFIPSRSERASRDDKRREAVEWGAFLFALLLLSPVPSTYHFAVMILCAVLLIDSLLREREKTLAVAATLLYFFASIADFIHLFARSATGLGWMLAISRLWFGSALFAVFLFHLYRLRPRETNDSARVRAAMLAGFAALVMTTGVLGYRHHFFHREQEMGRRILPPEATLFAGLPQKDSGGYAYVAMDRTGYHVSRPGADAQNTGDGRPDELSYTIAPDGTLFAETADVSGSRILRVSDHATVAEDAESPAISSDGKQLAFVREQKGRGSLWIASLASPQSSPVRVTSDEYDVREVSFLRSGDLLFLARHDGRSRLFTVAREDSPHTIFSTDAEIASFAVSPDEHRIAVTQLIQNRWQLAVAELQSSHAAVLTSTDCNAYSPAWISSSRVVYGTDCGRGVGLTALATLAVPSAAR